MIRNLLLTACIAMTVAVFPSTVTDEREPAQAKELAPTNAQSRTMMNIVDQVRKNHLLRRKSLDDEASSFMYDKYLDRLDRDAMFLLQSDIDEFEIYRNEFDDAFKRGNLKPAYEIYNRLLQRVADRVNWVEERLDRGIESFDLTTARSIPVDRSEEPWTQSPEEADALWEDQLTNSIIVDKLAGDDDEEILEELRKDNQIRTKQVTQVRSEDVFEQYMNIFTQSYDPHTNYFPRRASENFELNMSLSLEGIGAELGVQGEYIVIRRLVKGGPAELQGGVRKKDRIVAVGQEKSGPLIDVVGWRLDDVVDLIRGPKSTVVVLELLEPDEDGGEKRIVAITRDKVDLEQSAASSKVFNVDAHGQELTVGIIDLPSMYADFQAYKDGKPNYRSATRDVSKLISKMQAENDIDALIIDLRENSGGALEEAHKLVALFVPSGPTVQVSGERKPIVWYDRDELTEWDGPLAVIVNRRSASASEIFAGAIQDYRRGIVVGTQTFGKGTVQQLFPLRSGNLKITLNKYYRISGQGTQHQGVVPDIEFPDVLDPNDHYENKLDNALPWDEIEPAEFEVQSNLAVYIPELRERHQSRVETNPDFTYFREITKRWQELDRKRTVSLNLETRKQNREEERAARLAPGNAFLVAKGREPAETISELRDAIGSYMDETEDQPDGIIKETANILGDYVSLRSGISMATPSTSAPAEFGLEEVE